MTFKIGICSGLLSFLTSNQIFSYTSLVVQHLFRLLRSHTEKYIVNILRGTHVRKRCRRGNAHFLITKRFQCFLSDTTLDESNLDSAAAVCCKKTIQPVRTSSVRSLHVGIVLEEC